MKTTVELFRIVLHYYYTMYFGHGTMPYEFSDVETFISGEIKTPNKILIRGWKKNWFRNNIIKEVGRVTFTKDDIDNIKGVKFYVNGAPANHQDIIQELKKHFTDIHFEDTFYEGNEPRLIT